MAAINIEQEIVYLKVEQVAGNRYQPRRFFDNDSLEGLAKSIEEYGVMQPISVRPADQMGMYELVAGERRLMASRLAGLATIPAIVVNIKDQDSAMLAVIENIQREDLNYIEEAVGYAKLLQDYRFTQEELARKLGKSQSTIANKLRILRLSEAVIRQLVDHELSERHARALLKLETEGQQLKILQRVIKEQLNVSKTEALIDRLLAKGRMEGEKGPAKVKLVVKDLRLFSNSIKQSLNLMKDSGYETEYLIDEQENGCEILIKVSYGDLA